MLVAEQKKQNSEQLENEAPGLIAHGDSILQRVHEAHAPHKMLTPADLRDYIAGTLTSVFEGTRFDRIPQLELEAFETRLSPKRRPNSRCSESATHDAIRRAFARTSEVYALSLAGIPILFVTALWRQSL